MKIWISIGSILIMCIIIRERVWGLELEAFNVDKTVYGEEETFGISFMDIVTSFIENDYKSDGKLLDKVFGILLSEIRSEKQLIIKLIIFIIGGSVINTFVDITKEESVIKASSFLFYSMAMLLIFNVFKILFDISLSTSNKVMDFLLSLTPTFFGAYTVVHGKWATGIMYQWTASIITFTNMICCRILFPLVNYYMIIGMINCFGDNKKNFGGVLKLMKKIIIYINRGLIGILVGLTAIRNMSIPVISSLKNTIIKKTIVAIPGIGQSAQAITDTITKSGILIKNTIGIAGIVCVILILLIPYMKMLLTNIVLRLIVAITGPIAEKNIIDGIEWAADAIGLLMYITCTTSLVFILIITILCVLLGG